MNSLGLATNQSSTEDLHLITNHLEFLSIVQRPIYKSLLSRPRKSKVSTESLILLVDADQCHRESLETALRERDYAVLACDPNDLKQHSDFVRLVGQARLVIFDLTVSSKESWRGLVRICRFRSINGEPLPVICPTRMDRGPEFELAIERLGAQLLYA